MAHHKDPPQWMGLPVGDLCSGHAMVLHIPASATSSMFLSDKSSSLYDLHLTSVQSSSSASHKRKKIYLAKRSSRAFNELRLATRNFRSNSVILEGDFSSALEITENVWYRQQGLLSLQSQVSMMNNCFFCTSLCIRSLEDHMFTIKDITQRFGASLSAIVVTFFTRSHDCSMRRWDRTEEPFFLELKSLHFFLRPCLSHVHLLRSCSTRKLSDFGLVRDCPKGVMGTFGYAVPQYVST
uniref:Protein kinase domain-containing protein n=1 Tax=Brassica oleracea var. oleracea TaxID=109376 RepID=A0A0D3DS32_BRAOL